VIYSVTDNRILHIGSYTRESGGKGLGITAVERDPHTGALTDLGLVAATPSPSFLAWHPTLPVLYAVNELRAGTVTAWRTDTGATSRGDTGGDSPCHLAVTPDGNHLIATNYASGSVAVHALDPSGAIGDRTDLLEHRGHGPDRERQASAHPHMVSAHPAPVLVVDLGTDAVYPYGLDQGRLVPNGPRIHLKAGTGPRHLARHPDGRRVFVVGELDPVVTVFGVDDHGWHQRHRVPASARPGLRQPSEIALGPDGRFLYVANRGANTIAVFAVDGAPAVDDAGPALVDEVDCLGDWPRHFAVIGEHLYVANERSHSIAVFRIDAVSGNLSAIGGPHPSRSPTCVLPAFAADAGFLAT
jgi:6-phosphogluconolactonase